MTKAASSADALDGSVFMAAVLCAAILYFFVLDSGSRALAPALVPGAVFGQVVWRWAVERKAPPINRGGLQLLGVYVALCVLGVAIHQTADFFAVRKFLIPTTIFLVGVFRYQSSDRKVFWFFTALFVVGLLQALGDARTAPTATGYQFSTYAATESIFSLALGAGAVWLFSRKCHLMALALAVGCLVLYKRNAIVDMAVCLAAVYVFQILVAPKFRAAALGIVACLVALLLTALSFYLTDIFRLVSENISGATSVSVSTGRDNIYRMVQYQLSNNTIDQWIFGRGPGSVERMIDGITFINSSITLAHNEYFSLIYDFGLFGWALFLASLARMAFRSFSTAAVCLYVFAMILIENLLFISFVTMAIMFLLSLVKNPAQRGAASSEVRLAPDRLSAIGGGR